MRRSPPARRRWTGRAALTEDLEGAREEAESLRGLLDRLSALQVPVQPYYEPLRAAQDRIEKFEVGPAREAIRETMRRLGRTALEHLELLADRVAKIVEVARERGFLPAGTEASLAKARQTLADGALADAGELLAACEVELRTAAGPYVARVVEELEHGFGEIHDDALVAPARRLLADADVSLRVKEDVVASLESLKRAEREFAAVFAAHASSLVEALEEEGRALEAMGGAGDEIQRQIDEVQQIFNMGEFVKASRASQEIRTRAQQQQLVRSEESVSHAKLALVELGKMGLDTAVLRERFDKAQDAAREHRFAEAFQAAKAVEEEASEMRRTAEAIVEGLQRAGDLWQGLKDDGVPVDTYREQIRETRLAYQALDFAGAKAKLRSLEDVLATERASSNAARRFTTVELLLEDAQRLGLTTDVYRAEVDRGRAALTAGDPRKALEVAEGAQETLLQLLRPVLEENVRSLEQELDIARAAGVDTDHGRRGARRRAPGARHADPDRGRGPDRDRPGPSHRDARLPRAGRTRREAVAGGVRRGRDRPRGEPRTPATARGGRDRTSAGSSTPGRSSSADRSSGSSSRRPTTT